MILDRITVDGFANISRTTINFQDIVSLVALNSYGKTNLLRAINLGFDYITRDSSIKENILHYMPGVPMNQNGCEKPYYFCIEGRSTLNDEDIHLKYEFGLSWAAEGREGFVSNEELSIKHAGVRTQFKDYITRQREIAYRRASQSGRCDYLTVVDKSELVINKLMAYDELFFIDVVKDINRIIYVLENHLDPSQAYKVLPLIPKNGRGDPLHFSNIDDDINHTLFTLRKHYPDKYELLENTFLMLFPHIEKISLFETEFKLSEDSEISFPEDVFQLPDKEYKTFIYEKNRTKPVSADRLSDGTQRILLFLIYIIAAEINKCTLIALEEAENSIHPSLLQSFLSIITQIAGNCRIIVTSHSPYLIQYLDPSKIYIGLPNEKGLAQFKRINGKCSNSLLKDAYKYGITIGDYIFKLISGVDNDIETLNRYLECSE